MCAVCLSLKLNKFLKFPTDRSLETFYISALLLLLLFIIIIIITLFYLGKIIRVRNKGFLFDWSFLDLTQITLQFTYCNQTPLFFPAFAGSFNPFQL